MAVTPVNVATELSSSDPRPGDAQAQGVDAPDLRRFASHCFFIFGGITSLHDVIIPKLKDPVTLSYFHAMSSRRSSSPISSCRGPTLQSSAVSPIRGHAGF